MDSLSVFIAKKYSLSKLIGYVAIIALAFGIACILTVAAIMNGFYEILDNKLSNIVSNAIIFNTNDNINEQISKLASQKNLPYKITNLDNVLQTQAFFTNNNKIEYLAIQNSTNNAKNHNGLTISAKYAKENNIELNQNITLIFNNKKNELIYLPIKVTNIDDNAPSILNQIGYISKNNEYYNKIFNEEIPYSTNLQITLENPHDALDFKNFLIQKFSKDDQNLVIYTWDEIFGSILDGIAYTKQIMFIILFFMIIVATFNVLATISITIKEKRQEIAILQTIGATKGIIFKIFISQGIIFATTALILGTILSYIICFYIADITKIIESLFHIVLINKDNYLIDYLPTKYSLKDVLYISLLTYAINLFISIVPSYRAAKMHPVKLLRYE